MAPFKKPDSELPNNEIFNNHVSIVRIRSEHAIGFLKGRFQSLKGLHIKIKDENSHKFATYWVASCIGIHAFAMKCEKQEAEEDSDEYFDDPFIREGLSSTEDEDLNSYREPVPTTGSIPRAARGRAASLAEAKRRREYLKEKLLRAKADQVQNHNEAEQSSDSDFDS